MRRFGALFVSVLLMCGLLGIGLVAQGQTEYKFFIVSHGGAVDPFWGVVNRGMQDAANLLSEHPEFNVSATYFGPEVAAVEEVVRLLDSAIAAAPDGLAVTITDARALNEPVRYAIDQGIPVIAINVPDMRAPDERIPYLFYVGGDEYLGGVHAAQRFIQIAEERGIEITGGVVAPQEVGHLGLEARADGFVDTMAEHGIPAEKLQIYGEDPTRSVEILRSYFVRNPETNVLFTLGPMGTLPGITFLKEEGLVDDVIYGTYDLDTTTMEGIREGVVEFTVTQQQYLQGFLPMVYLALYNHYGLRPIEDVLTGPAFVDKTNIELVAEMIEKGYW